jgi:hypothetical protein
MRYEFAASDGLSLSTSTQPRKFLKDPMGNSAQKDENPLRGAVQLWAASWISAELRSACERGSQADAAERA